MDGQNKNDSGNFQITKQIDQVEEKINTIPKIKLTSPKVMLIYLIGILRNLSGCYYTCQIKYIGIIYINNDDFVTLTILASISINFIFTFGFGPIVERINFFNTIYLCQFCTILNGLFGLGLYLTRSKIFFVLFSFASRATIGLLIGINYTLPYKLFGTENGLYLMRFLDFQTLPGILITSGLNYVFVNINRLHWMFFVLILLDLLCMFLISVFVKRFPQSETDSPA